jgi:hypothetical protein
MRVDSFTVVDSIPHFRCSFWAASLWLSVFLRPANNSSIFYRQQLAGRAGKPHFVRCERILIPIRGPGRCASFKGSQVCQQAID